MIRLICLIFFSQVVYDATKPLRDPIVLKLQDYAKRLMRPV